MSLTLFGIIWLVLIAHTFIRLKLKHFIFLTLFSMIFQCNNVIMIGSQGIGPQLITSFFFILRSLSVKGIRSRANITSITLFCWGCFFICILINAQINGIFSDIILDIIQILIYFMCAVRMYKCRYVLSANDYKKYVLGIISFIAIFAPIQFLATNGIIPRGLLEPFFFNDPNPVVYFHRPEIYKRLLATFMEPSYCSSFLVGSIAFTFHLRSEINK